MPDLAQEIAEETSRRRTFAIISHPDAGKTTLTEKLLLFGGAIRLAGTVKGRKANKFATSDWMEIEKQRGISVTSSVLQFEYKGHKVNILDTPGHQDFSEDTYRTLTAADCAVMLIDVAKGVEAQTKKLFEVCSKRGIPIFTFINKLDREGRDPFDLLEELEQVLGIRSYPMNWPIGMGRTLCGVYDRRKVQVELYQGDDHQTIAVEKVQGFDDEKIRQYRKTIQTVPGVKKIRDIKGRYYGNNAVLDIVITVHSSLNIGEAHDISTRVEQALKEQHDIYEVHVHVEPNN